MSLATTHCRAALGIDATYEPIDTPTVDLPEAVKALRGEDYLGANIGVPHKDQPGMPVARLAAAHARLAEEGGAGSGTA